MREGEYDVTADDPQLLPLAINQQRLQATPVKPVVLPYTNIVDMQTVADASVFKGTKQGCHHPRRISERARTRSERRKTVGFLSGSGMTIWRRTSADGGE